MRGRAVLRRNSAAGTSLSIIGQEVHACLNRNKSPAEAAADAQEQIEQIERKES